MAFPPICNTRKMANYVRESFIWRWRSALRPPRSLPEDFHILCSRFLLSKAEGAAVDFELPQIVQTKFSAMLLNEAVELGVAYDYTVESMKSSLIGLRWSTFEVWMDCVDHTLRECSFIGRPMKWRSVVPKTARMRALDRSTPGPLLVTRSSKKGEDQVHSTHQIPNELLAEGTQGNPRSAPFPSNPEAEVAFSRSSSTLGTASSSSSFEGSSSERASTSCSSSEVSLGPGKLVLKRKVRTPGVTEIMAKGSVFPGASTHSDSQDDPGSHFPDPKVVTELKRSALEKQYLLPVGYTLVIPEADATVNEPAAKCIAVYRVSFNYGLRFFLHPVIMEILNKYELAPAQVMPTSWHNICSFIATCELRGLTCSAWVFNLVHTVQKAPKETGDLRWCYFNNRPGFITTIEKKSKVKYWKHDFLFLRRESGWGDDPDWNENKPVRNSFGEPTAEERRTTRYFQFYIREDDKP
ncbi:hypothetical protein Cgig2_007106 [Carnegiea gigantea]|uniref:Uncharacterized protein n=1 Tax=Carnegiea gigantea TaxID=171969 RepID=A0A9Q1JYH6_9CARY|nr:hypothetical protein Cgig2_007106 [Carnegiea gigantea]